MAGGTGGWLPPSTNQPGVRQPNKQFACGEARTWSVAVPGKDLTGYTAHWILGSPPEPQMLGLFNTAYMGPPVILVEKTTAAGTLSILPVQGGSALYFSTAKLDTLNVEPGIYWQQAVTFDPLGNPVVVAEGQVTLTPSFLALDLS